MVEHSTPCHWTQLSIIFGILFMLLLLLIGSLEPDRPFSTGREISLLDSSPGRC
ncbi:hypothetical protein BDV40DRAFT_251539 [Aspergillus tamarii]|uniref:Uncharacterized protein n=1 Tax=Aspergillus tamarii TaxID=41984 RepID=A0A5N6VB35_ASPTM|nr:hypothetical protein BDV40DRAFT_251539 [Aspergillus tamarii]